MPKHPAMYSEQQSEGLGDGEPETGGGGGGTVCSGWFAPAKAQLKPGWFARAGPIDFLSEGLYWRTRAKTALGHSGARPLRSGPRAAPGRTRV